MTVNTPAVWDAEYRSGGLPSSVKDAPSTTVLWGLANLPFLGVPLSPGDTVLDVGCGTGRNALAVAARTGARVVGLDYSGRAVETAHARLDRLPDDRRPLLSFEQHDVRDGLPAATGAVALVMDVFVYFHLVAAADRAAYVAEVCRVLRPDGALLLCLAPPDDGYYATCPTVGESGGVTAGVDPVLGVGHVLHTLDTLRAELAPALRIAISWRKESTGLMHGTRHHRVTLATLSRMGGQ